MTRAEAGRSAERDAAPGCGSQGNYPAPPAPLGGETAAHPDDPPGIDPYTHDLPSADDARERVIAFLRWYGDGRVFVETDESCPPLYARDLEALTRVTPPGAPS